VPNIRQIERAEIAISAGEAELAANFALPVRATGLVIFAHGSGSSRRSPRNRHVAGVLNHGGLSTLLVDLLTKEEEAVDLHTAELRFDIGLLVTRLTAITDGRCGSRICKTSELDISEPARAPPLPWAPPPNAPISFRPWCRAEEGRILPVQFWAGSLHRVCLSWEATIPSSST
jgi:hypothetical protein